MRKADGRYAAFDSNAQADSALARKTKKTFPERKDLSAVLIDDAA